tara:strand:- start:39 stop:245 length:207 start_codon:yes stop_codon:yes gene_type:complete
MEFLIKEQAISPKKMLLLGQTTLQFKKLPSHISKHPKSFKKDRKTKIKTSISFTSVKKKDEKNDLFNK